MRETAFLKDLLVTGAARFLNLLAAEEISTTKLNVPTASSGTTLGPGTNGQVLKTNGTTIYWGADNNTTYGAATQSAQGLMSSADKTKLDGIATGASNVTEATVSGWGFTKNTGTYSKPSGGIPKTDLASAVQTSLDKADTALQSFTETLQTCYTCTGTAAVTSSPYYASRWNATVDSSITALKDGLTVIIKVPVAGHGTYGTLLNVNNLGYHPVVYNINSMISTRYSVGSVIIASYNSTQTATAYVNSASASTITGVWQVMDYDSTNVANLRYDYARYKVATGINLYRYQFCLQTAADTLTPTNNVSNSTGTTKTLITTEWNPFGSILYYSSTTTKNAGEVIGDSTLYATHPTADLRYSFNTGTTLTANKSVYLVGVPQSNGMCKLASTPIVQALPTTNNGNVYIYLGCALDTYRITLSATHPIVYHDGNGIREWTGAKTIYSDDAEILAVLAKY